MSKAYKLNVIDEYLKSSAVSIVSLFFSVPLFLRNDDSL